MASDPHFGVDFIQLPLRLSSRSPFMAAPFPAALFFEYDYPHTNFSRFFFKWSH
jgi:hypothetical protein